MISPIEEHMRKAREREKAVEAFMKSFVDPSLRSSVLQQLYAEIARAVAHISSVKPEGDALRLEAFAGYDVGDVMKSAWNIRALTKKTVVCCMNGVEITMAKKEGA